MNRVFHEISDMLRRYYLNHTVCSLDKLHMEVVDNSNKTVFPELPFKQKISFKIPMTANITTYINNVYQLHKK